MQKDGHESSIKQQKAAERRTKTNFEDFRDWKENKW